MPNSIVAISRAPKPRANRRRRTNGLPSMAATSTMCAPVSTWAFSPGGDAQTGIALTAAAVPVWVQIVAAWRMPRARRTGAGKARCQRRRCRSPAHAAVRGARLVADVRGGAGARGGARLDHDARTCRQARRSRPSPARPLGALHQPVQQRRIPQGPRVRPALRRRGRRFDRCRRPDDGRPSACHRAAFLRRPESRAPPHRSRARTSRGAGAEAANCPLPVRPAGVLALFPGAYPVAAGSWRSGVAHRQAEYRGRTRHRARADLLQRAGAGRLPGDVSRRRSRCRRALLCRA